MDWTKESEKELSKVPFFVRKKVRKKVEEFVKSQGRHKIFPKDLHKAKAAFVSKMHEEIKGFRIESCFSGSGCKNAIYKDLKISEKLENILISKDILSFLKKKLKSEKLKFHHEFTISISNCPNSCSRPQVADIGIIAAVKPGLVPEKCSFCGKCKDICIEGAISYSEKSSLPEIDFQRCLFCGHCIKGCKDKALVKKKKGFRVLAGGRLGRHPRLGIDLGKIFSEEEVLSIVEKACDLLISTDKDKCRFADIFQEEDIEKLLP